MANNHRHDNIPEPNSPDDALFQALGKSKKRKKRRLIRTVLSIVLVLAIVLSAVVTVLQRRVQDRFSAVQTQVLSYEVTTGTISTLVSGSGTLQNVDTETVTFPAGVELTEILVDDGDWVEAGDLIATADMGTVQSAMSALQTSIGELDEQISDAEGDKVSSYIKAGVTGRVKRLFAQTDTDVVDTMVEQGALAVLSLDGFMAADLETDLLSPGDAVSVTRADGTQLSGTVQYAAGGKATILVTDNGPRYGEEVTVSVDDGTLIGTAALYVHSPLSVTGYAGTVSRVNVKENQKVYASTTLFTLSNTASSANYDALLRQRKEAEETLVELLRIQRSGGITAPISGSVCSAGDVLDVILTEVATLSPDVSMSVTITVDESDILSLAVGQQADVTVSSVREEAYEGIVTEIDKTGTSGYYTAVITLRKAEGMLSGMTASVDIRIEGVDNALIIPVDALNQTSTGAYVYTSYDEQAQEYGGRVDVVTGLSNSNFVEIRSGLSAGDLVYYTEDRSFGFIFGNMGGRGGTGQNTGFEGGQTPGGMPGGGDRPSGSRG